MPIDTFNIFDVFKVDYWNETKNRERDSISRPPARLKSVEPEFRSHDRGRGQEIRNEYFWQIPFLQQKMLYQRNPWVKKCIDHISNTAANLEWHIVPKDEYLLDFKTDLHMQVAHEWATQVFTRRNTLKQSFRDMIKMLIRDLKVMDAAALEKARDTHGRIVGLKVVDAATIRVDTDAHGQILKYYQELRGSNIQGLFAQPYNVYGYRDKKGLSLIEFDPEELIYLKLNPRSEGPYGSSPIASLVDAIYADLSTDINLFNFLQTGGVNLGFMTIGREIDNDVAERIREKFRQSLTPGNRYDFPIVAHSEEVKWNPMQMNNQEAQMAELQVELRNKILAVLSIPPNELGLTGSSRGQVYSQQDVFWGNCILPMMNAVAEKFTDEIIAEFDPRLRFEFLPPKEYQFEALMSRIVTLEEQGLIDDDTKFLWLGIPKPENETYVAQKKRLELKQMELGVRDAELTLAIKEKNFPYLAEQPKLEYEQMVAQSDMMAEQAGISMKQMEVQERELELQNKELDMRTTEMEHEKVMADKEMEMTQVQSQVQGAQMEQQMQMLQMMQAGQPMQQPAPMVSNEQLVQHAAVGNLDTASLATMMQQGMVDPEQLKQISAASKMIKTLAMAKSLSSDLMKPIKMQPISGVETPESLTSGKTVSVNPERKLETNLQNPNNTETVSQGKGTVDRMIQAMTHGIDSVLQGNNKPGENYVPQRLAKMFGAAKGVQESPTKIEREQRNIADGSIGEPDGTR